MIEAINQIAGAGYGLTSNYPAGMLTRLRYVASTTAHALPESLRETKNSIRDRIYRRTYLPLVLAGVTTGQVLFDDSLFYGIHRVAKNATDGGVVAPWIVTSTLATAFQGGVALLNQKHLNPRSNSSNSAHSFEDAPTRKSISRRLEGVKSQIGKAGISLFALGVPGHSVSGNLSRNQVYSHAALWGLTAPLWYSVIDVGLGPLDYKATPFAIMAAMAGRTYVNEMCDRAAWRADVPVSERTNFALNSVINLVPVQTEHFPPPLPGTQPVAMPSVA